MSAKDVQIFYTTQSTNTGNKYNSYFIPISVQVGITTDVQIISQYVSPIPGVTAECEDPKLKVWIASIRGSVVNIKARCIHDASAILRVVIFDGSDMKKITPT
jgi:hypothetical protein